MSKTPKTPKSKQGGFVVGRNAFSKIAEIEGLTLSGQMKQDFRKFDRDGVPPAERRRSIIAKYGKKS